MFYDCDVAQNLQFCIFFFGKAKTMRSDGGFRETIQFCMLTRYFVLSLEHPYKSKIEFVR